MAIGLARGLLITIGFGGYLVCYPSYVGRCVDSKLGRARSVYLMLRVRSRCVSCFVHNASLTMGAPRLRPPVVSFKWRHWGVMQGPLRCPLGHGQELSASATGQKIQVSPCFE